MKEEIMNLLKIIEKHDESYEEIKELIFTDKMKEKKYNTNMQNQIVNNFLKLKQSLIMSLKKDEDLTYMEAFILYRLIVKITNKKESVLNTFNALFDNTQMSMDEFISNKNINVKFPIVYFKQYLKNIK